MAFSVLTVIFDLTPGEPLDGCPVEDFRTEKA